MMSYHVVISDYALNMLKNLEGCSDPRLHGKALTADHKGKWRYRVGECRILALIEDERILIKLNMSS